MSNKKIEEKRRGGGNLNIYDISSGVAKACLGWAIT
jgi:hypothetical protein